MSNDHRTRLEQIFRAVFELPMDAPVVQIRKGDIHTWDSLAHVLLVAAIENEFDLAVDPTASMQLDSFESIEHYVAHGGR
ncbi:MAG TPA: acyl carrier protein [Steroidobacter sp.]|nr:acyl carrier protein [Steroidobacter sp.]